MSRKHSNPVKLPLWKYLGGEAITPGADASAPATIPSEATIFQIAAEGEDIYYAINAVSAVAGSPGFVAQNGRVIEGPLTNLDSLAIFSDGAGIAHISYYVESTGRGG